MRISNLILAVLFITLGCSKSDNTSEEDTSNLSLPVVVLSEINDITLNSATSGGNVTGDGGLNVIARGICWSTSPNPNINDNKTTNGSGLGVFTSQMNGLDSGVTYYIRAYATNDLGTTYSSELTFETTSSCNQNTITEQVILTTQQEVNDFGAINVCTIANDLFIRVPQGGTSDPIVDLTPLSSLEVVEGGLYILDLSELETLNGLENLIQARKALYINKTERLVNVAPLSNLTGEITELVILQNQSLQNLDGLSGLTTFVEGEFGQDPQIGILFNPVLQNIDGLSNIATLGQGDGSTFGLQSNPMINDIDAVAGFSGDIDIILISFNSSLWNVNALQGVTSCKEFYLGYNVISDYSGLQNLTSVTFNMEISGTGTSRLDVLENLVFVGGNLKFTDNPSLFNYCGLQNLVDANGLQGDFITQNNFYNPTYQDLLNGDCSF